MGGSTGIAKCFVYLRMIFEWVALLRFATALRVRFAFWINTIALVQLKSATIKFMLSRISSGPHSTWWRGTEEDLLGPLCRWAMRRATEAQDLLGATSPFCWGSMLLLLFCSSSDSLSSSCSPSFFPLLTVKWLFPF